MSTTLSELSAQEQAKYSSGTYRFSVETNRIIFLCDQIDLLKEQIAQLKARLAEVEPPPCKRCGLPKFGHGDRGYKISHVYKKP